MKSIGMKPWSSDFLEAFISHLAQVSGEAGNENLFRIPNSALFPRPCFCKISRPSEPKLPLHASAALADKLGVAAPSELSCQPNGCSKVDVPIQSRSRPFTLAPLLPRFKQSLSRCRDKAFWI